MIEFIKDYVAYKKCYKYSDKKDENLLANIKKIFNNEKNIVLFKKRNIIKIIENENELYVIKSFKIPHIINKFVYNFFRDSKAKRSYDNSIKLQKLNINTPKPIGYVEFSTLFLFKESFYISNYFPYDYEIRDVFKDTDFKNNKELIKQFVEFTYDLHNKNVYHIDYSPGNILIKENNNRYNFFIIDVNRMKFTKFDLKLRCKSMSKLTSNTYYIDLIKLYYSQISNINIDILSTEYNYYLKKQKKYLENKKMLKA